MEVQACLRGAAAPLPSISKDIIRGDFKIFRHYVSFAKLYAIYIYTQYNDILKIFSRFNRRCSVAVLLLTILFLQQPKAIYEKI